MVRPRAVAPVLIALLIAAAVVLAAVGVNRSTPAERSPVAEAFAAAGGSTEFNVTRWDLIDQFVGSDVADAAGRNAITRSLLAGSDEEIATELSWRVTDLVWETYVPGVDGFMVARLGSDVASSDDEIRQEFIDASLTPTLKRFARHVEVRAGVLAAGLDADIVADALQRALNTDISAAGAELARAVASASSLWVQRGDLECAGSAAQWTVRALTLRDESTDLQSFARLFADVSDARADTKARRASAAQLAGTDDVTTSATGHTSVVTLPVDPYEQEFMSGSEPPGFAACELG